MPLRSYAGGAKRTALSGDITATSTSIQVVDATGYPAGVDGPFVISLALGSAGEEKVLVASRSGNTLTVATGGRGFDGTTAAAHASGTAVDHVLTATDLREANTHVNDTTGDPHPQYLTPAEADALFLTPAEGDALFLTPAEGDALFLTPAEGDTAYVRKDATKAAIVLAAESTASTGFTDLLTIGPSRPVTIGPNGRCEIVVGAHVKNDTAGGYALMGYVFSGGPTARSSGDLNAYFHQSATAHNQHSSTKTVVEEGLAAGDYTVTAKYRAIGGTATFEARRLTVTAL